MKYPLTHPENFGKWKVKEFTEQAGHGMTEFYSYIVTDSTKEDSPDRLLKAPTPRYIDRLKYETKLLEKLKHPNIVKLIDYDLEADIPYKVVELSNHGEFWDALPTWPLHKLRADGENDIVRQFTRAVGYLHSQGIRHNAIDRHHILIFEDYTPKIVRFRDAEIFNDTHFNTFKDMEGLAREIASFRSKTRQLFIENAQGNREERMEKLRKLHIQPTPPKALTK